MKIIEPIAYLLTLIFALTIQMVYFLKDDRTANHTKEDLKLKDYWHGAALILHIWCGVIIGRAFGWQWTPVTSSTMWLTFDGAVNTWVLNLEWFYVGTTALVDKAQRTIAGWIQVDPRLLSAIVKISFFTGSILLLIFY